MSHTMFGKWSQPDVPHKGWSCTGIEDAGAPDHCCEMCEAVMIRFIHTMQHPDYPGTLVVGCICAGHLEEDYLGARRRENDFKRSRARRSRWLTRQWSTSRSGNDYLNSDGFNVVVYPRGGGWVHRFTGQRLFSKQLQPTAEQAKLVAFDIITAWQQALHGKGA